MNVYTSHYFVKEEYVVIPLQAFLMSVGAEYADSDLNEYGRQCYSFMGKRYVIMGKFQLFMLEDEYVAFTKQLDEDGKALTITNTANKGLLPKSENHALSELFENGIPHEIWTDHISLMNALRESGIDITIEYDYSTRTITVTMPQ